MSTLQEIRSAELTRCSHCGTEFRERELGDEFCCSGCEYVYGLIHEENLDKFYELQGSHSSPIGFRVFGSNEYNWLKGLVEQVEAKNRKSPSLTLSLEGVSCIGCVWLIEKLFSSEEGSKSCRIDVHRGEIEIAWIAGEFDPVDCARRLHKFGYDLSVRQSESSSENKKIVWRMAICGAFALNAMLYTLPSYLGMEEGFLFSRHFDWLSGIFATLSMLIGGSYFIQRATVSAMRRVVHMDLPISIGLVVAYAASCYAFLFGNEPSLQYFDFISTFVFLMLCGKWLQIFAIERNRNRLASLEIHPPIVSKIEPNGDIQELDTSEIEPGDRYVLDPGLWIPVESELVSDRACLGMDWINGETESRLFASGSRVPSGSINQGGAGIELIAGERWEDSLLNKLLKSRGETTRSDQVAQKWISIYLVSVIAIATVGAGVWVAFGSVSQAIVVFVSALVVSCPCALGVALPLANELASSLLRLKGVFVRTNTLWNRLSKVTQVVFDKTGTLTRSTLDWTNPSILSTLDDRALEALSAMTMGSRHPIASTVYETLLAKGSFKLTQGWKIEEQIGSGIVGEKDGVSWRFGKAEWAAAGAETESTVLSRGGQAVARFTFGDRPWADAAFEVQALKNAGMEVSILSGDTPKKVQEAAACLGISADHAIGAASPEMKRDWLRRNGGKVSLILGDGANDSLAFDEALCCGTPAAEKTTLANKADFYYLGAGIQGVRSLLTIASLRSAAIRLLVAFAVAYNLVTISLALAGIVTPLMAAILMPLSSIGSLLIAWGSLRSTA